MLYIGIDLGTSAVKLLLMDADGKIKKIASRTYDLSFPHPGWSEQNPADWYEQSIDGLKELLAECDKSRVAGISFGGQMHGLVTLDERDEVIRPAILWNDGRTAEETDYLNQVIGKETLSGYTANIAFAGFTAPKILWMQKHEPDLWKRVKKIMLPKDYLAYRLSGTFCTDYSDASGMLLLDVEHRAWSEQMLEICHVEREQLPKLYESYEVVGTLKPEIAEELGLSPEVKIIAGAGDNAAAAVGTGTVGEGRCNLSLGTSGTLFISSEKFGVDAHNALHSFDHADGGYHLMGCMLSAASCNKWWMDEILKTTEYAREQEKIKNLGENRVFFLPYLMGERSPHNDPDARAMFLGMSMDTTREDMTQAVLEGVAFGLRDSLEVARSLGIRIERSKICGGGAKSPLWKKILAAVLNLKLDLIESEEGPGYGGAILAAVGCGEYESVQAACEKLVHVVDTVEPDPVLVEKYEARYQEFRKLYPEVNFQIYEGNTYQMLDGLKTNQMDLALVRSPFPESGFVCHKYQEEHIVAAGIVGTLPQNAGIEEISGQPLILYRRWETLVRQIFESRNLRTTIVAVVDNAWSSLQMAKAGIGIAMLPESFVADISGMEMWRIEDERLQTRLTLVKRDDRYISNIAKIFFEKFEL